MGYVFVSIMYVYVVMKLNWTAASDIAVLLAKPIPIATLDGSDSDESQHSIVVLNAADCSGYAEQELVPTYGTSTTGERRTDEKHSALLNADSLYNAMPDETLKE